ncbi:hypothetical protein K458DRAFT_478370 [Lentithecium fluviatile CBS 122367]|uniref:F-box domain-containing protein n=1 Tax=Lentithecium fluviatile CBS 122367 TaxID=1168545 RepID=A0A6G1IZV0_9PLEO|nr:hypothetical protein K458DRAFT_478370 [Lentithecium fluviatile CBS 122367]
MSYSSEPPHHTARTSQEHNHTPVNAEGSIPDSGTPPNDPAETNAPPTKRSDVLRHVFPRPRTIPSTQKTTARVSKPERRKTPPSSSKQSKRRVAFHKVFTSFFHNSPATVTPHPINLPVGSSASSTRSRPGSGSLYGSMPSLEFVSPGAFIFSGPSLRSRSGSYSNSASRLPSLTENGSDRRSLRRISLFEDGTLEPYAEHGVVQSMSDVLLGIGTPMEEFDVPVLEDVEEDIQSWPEDYPASYRAPNEMLQHIYQYLSPKDFNAARHTCRSWMRASLDKNILATMLQRGGWWSSAEADLEKRNRVTSRSPSAIPASEEWFISQRLSRECALSSGWTGNGLDSATGRKVVVEVSNTDFTDLATGHSGPDGRRGAGLVFTASICGQFLLVARDTLIYVYELRGAVLVPVTSVVCPRRVLSVSMDVSSGRNAIAALLDGRMGMVCELHYDHKAEPDNSIETHVETQGHPYRTAANASIATSRESEFEARVDAADNSSLSQRRGRQHHEERNRTPFDSVDVQSNYEAVSLQEINDRRMYVQNHVNQTWNLNLRGAPSRSPSGIDSKHTKACARSIPLENGTSTFYRHLCSEDDPPRSVSICPQRRCVAFGCSAGIELHWIDALTGQSLSRWFPLTAPSDYLYFLAPRPGFESAKKLRLISSAAHPNDRPTICRKFFLGRPTVSSFWGSFGFESNSRRSGSPNCDHYHAIPLSDGHHVLFIDPQSGKLFMGCDAPLGGPTKLLRKVMFIPPPSVNGQPPRLYTAAFDMSWGARIVVAFGDTIVLYSVPPDICNLSRAEQKAESWDVYNSPPFNDEGRTPDHWLNWWDEPCFANRWGDNPIWPIAVRGTEIGTLRTVCELAISTREGITVWGFALDAQCKTWQLRNHADAVIRTRRYVCTSGVVHEAYLVDEGRDVIMTDALSLPLSPLPSPPASPPPSESETERSVGFDGCSSQLFGPETKFSHALVMGSEDSGEVKRLKGALSVENDEWVDLLDVRGCDAWFLKIRTGRYISLVRVFYDR